MRSGIKFLASVCVAGLAWGCNSENSDGALPTSSGGKAGNTSPGGTAGGKATGGSGSSVCPAGYGLCGLNCVDITKDRNNCGSCGKACAVGQVCEASACKCPSPQTDCSGQCVDLGTDAANCGQCGQACTAAAPACSQGQCGVGCATGETLCGSSCVNLQTTAAHCGACNKPCAGGQTCNQGTCACAGGQQLCGTACVDTLTNPAHCGACDKPCAGGATCQAGTCVGGTGGSGPGTGGGGPGTGGGTPATGGGTPGTGGGTPGTGGGTPGTGGAAQAGGAGSGGIPAGLPGVVAVTDSVGTLACVPLCPAGTPPTNPANPGWGYSNDYRASCVIPDTAAAKSNTPCITGQPLPANPAQAGVVVFFKTDNACVTDCAGEFKCVATCTYYTSPTMAGANDDGLADDWAWERNAQCIIPGTMTAHNTACTTGQPIPEPNPRPGIMVNGDPAPNSCQWSECVPICLFATTPSDPTYPDWGWEDNASCVLPGTNTAKWLPDGVVPRGCKDGTTMANSASCYYQYPPRTCVWPYKPPNFLAPPALDATKTVHNNFYVDGATLRDPYGAAFLIRGVNNSNGWYDACGQYMAYGALDNIAAQNANTVRIGWAFKSIDPLGPGGGELEKAIIGTTPGLLAEILYRVVELKMIPVITMNDTTGQTATTGKGSPDEMAQFYTTLSGGQPSVSYLDVLKAYQPYLLVGIANEWNGTNANFRTAYAAAIQRLRTAGVHNTLVITANAWGQGCNAVIADGANLLNLDDPDHNLLFDLHLYTYLDYGTCRTTTGVCGSAAVIQGCLNDLAGLRLPIMVGEFGVSHSSGAVAWEAIRDSTNTNSQGYVPWLWFGDTEYSVLNLNQSWDGPLTTTWGTLVLPYATSIAKATIFP
jgi:hypothetical protein